ncbi:glycoside hydrolase family 32 protein [Algoriphagus hitonicola]|nr:glycoside hydrolase family 32 protein [Algoriphagus hitonicola]
MNFRRSTIIMIFIAWVLSFDTMAQVKEGIYNEKFRPQIHFSPPSKWMNDPNGLVYLDGEYHLFYQYNPNGNTWGPMHWGHAISKDLVYWQHLPIALYPDEHGMIFSGSAVYDENNTSGLGTAENPPLVAIFTYHDSEAKKSGEEDVQSQGIAFSTRGRSWTKFSQNPVLSNSGRPDFRDPKVIWVNNKWVMSIAVKDKIQFFSSPNLINWTFESDFNPEWANYEGVWKCPDLFPLTLPSGEEKWILLVSVISGGPQKGSATQYFIGDFDGKTFTTDLSQIRWLDYGADNYAGVTWSNIPDADGRRIFIGWMSNWYYAQKTPTSPWRSAMTLPRELKLIGTDKKFALKSSPIDELNKLRKTSQYKYGSVISLEEPLVELELVPELNDFSISFSNIKGEIVTLNKSGDDLSFDRSNSGKVDFQNGFGAVHHVALEGLDIYQVQIFLDNSSQEIFINGGQVTLTNLLFPNESYDKVTLQGFKDKFTLHYLSSIW